MSPVRLRLLAGLAVAVLAGGGTACSSDGSVPAAPAPSASPSPTAWLRPAGPAAYGPAAAGPAATRYAGPGPLAVGTAVVDIGGPGRVQLWWPADPGAARGKSRFVYRFGDWLGPAATAQIRAGADGRTAAAVAGVPVSDAGRFPIVLFSHGFGSIPTQSVFLTEHLASWGFVVAAPDHRERDTAALLGSAQPDPPLPADDLARTLSWLSQQDGTPGTLLSGHLDLAHVGVAGHSAGGLDAVEFARAHPAVAPVISLAGVPDVPPTARPMLLMAGTADGVVALSGIRAFYDRLRAPKWLVVVAGAGHNAFDDFCPDARGSFDLGRLPVPPAIAAAARSGCQPFNTPPRQVWPLVDHASVALLRWTFGTDPEPVGLAASLGTGFPGLSSEVHSTQ